MHTLAQLRSGELLGIKRLTLAENLTEFPSEILSLHDSLEILDLSNNQLNSLPNEFSQLRKLKILFASNNCFESLPEVLGLCADLEMIGFKSNQIKQVSACALPAKLRWLTLTDNHLTSLPDALGERPRLQKLMLAGNRLTHIPYSLSQSHQLELVRISANRLSRCPEHLLDLPKLAWFAFAGNPFSESNSDMTAVPVIPIRQITLGSVLGEGASGIIYQARWNKSHDQALVDVAIKVFKGQITSDGYSEDELQACLQAGHHPNLVQSLAQVKENDTQALIMELIPGYFSNLGLPPSLESCTRDTFAEGFLLTMEQVVKMVSQMQNVVEHLHDNKVSHGDLYAHNTLFDQQANIIFGDFGAASRYHMLTEQQQAKVKQIEERALSHFIDDLLNLCDESEHSDPRYKMLQNAIVELHTKSFVS